VGLSLGVKHAVKRWFAARCICWGAIKLREAERLEKEWKQGGRGLR